MRICSCKGLKRENACTYLQAVALASKMQNLRGKCKFRKQQLKKKTSIKKYLKHNLFFYLLLIKENITLQVGDVFSRQKEKTGQISTLGSKNQTPFQKSDKAYNNNVESLTDTLNIKYNLYYLLIIILYLSLISPFDSLHSKSDMKIP